MKNIAILFIAFFCCSATYAQKKIKLTHGTRTRIIKQGMRVGYLQKGEMRFSKGILKQVDNDFIVVDDKAIPIAEITGIGRKRRGSGLFQFVCGYMTGSMIREMISPVDNTPSCNGCQTTTTVDEGVVAAEIAIGAVFIGLAINSISSNTPRNLSKWKLEIVE